MRFCHDRDLYLYRAISKNNQTSPYSDAHNATYYSTCKLSTINSLSLNYPVSSRYVRTLLLVLSLKLLSPVISLPSYAISTGSESLNASNTSSSRLPTKFSQPKLFTVITSSLLNVLAVLALHPSLLLLEPPTSSSLKITDLSFQYVSIVKYTSICIAHCAKRLQCYISVCR